MNKRTKTMSLLSQQGLAIIELALVLPLLTLLLFGFIEVGRALYQQNMLTKALSTGARFISRAPDAVTPDCQPGTAWLQVVEQARTLIAYPGAGDQLLLNGLDNGEALDFSVSRAGTVCVIRVEASLAYAAIAGIIPMLNDGRFGLSASVEERYIGD